MILSTILKISITNNLIIENVKTYDSIYEFRYYYMMIKMSVKMHVALSDFSKISILLHVDYGFLLYISKIKVKIYDFSKNPKINLNY